MPNKALHWTLIPLRSISASDIGRWAKTGNVQSMKQKTILLVHTFLPHSIKQISRPDKMITADEIRDAVQFGEIIEEYSEDQRGESCLVFHCKGKMVKGNARGRLKASRKKRATLLTAGDLRR